jgi:hypothetical protein
MSRILHKAVKHTLPFGTGSFPLPVHTIYAPKHFGETTLTSNFSVLELDYVRGNLSPLDVPHRLKYWYKNQSISNMWYLFILHVSMYWEEVIWVKGIIHISVYLVLELWKVVQIFFYVLNMISCPYTFITLFDLARIVYMMHLWWYLTNHVVSSTEHGWRNQPIKYRLLNKL